MLKARAPFHGERQQASHGMSHRVSLETNQSGAGGGGSDEAADVSQGIYSSGGSLRINYDRNIVNNQDDD